MDRRTTLTPPQSAHSQQAEDNLDFNASNHGSVGYPVPSSPVTVNQSEQQLPSSMTAGHSVHFATEPLLAPNQGADPAVSFDDSTFAGFLMDIMQDSPDFGGRPNLTESMWQTFPVKDVLDFGVDFDSIFSPYDPDLSSLVVSGLETSLQDTVPSSKSYEYTMSGMRTPELRNRINGGQQAFKRSIWQWTPAQQDNAYKEQLHLSLPYQDLEGIDNQFKEKEYFSNCRIDQGSRDQILAMMLTTCEPTAYQHVVSSFPSVDLLNNLIQHWFSYSMSQTNSYIHLPTFNRTGQCTELLAAVVAAGAALSTVSVIRKLGFAIQEALRRAIPSLFEQDNRMTRDLLVLQAYTLHLGIGLWSGDKRKMEIAESHPLPLITMMRRAGNFRRLKHAPVVLDPSEDEETLNGKWLNWVEAESWKRLAFHLLINDAQTSMSLLTPTLITYTELSVDLPLSSALWTARTSAEWASLYRVQLNARTDKLPHLAQCLYDPSPILYAQDCLDVPFAMLIVLYGMWTLIWDHVQLDSTLKLQPPDRFPNSTLITSAWHKELCQLLTQFRTSTSDWDTVKGLGMQPEAIVVQERSLMNLHVSFEDVQLFAGKEGEEEARRVYPKLKAWSRSRDARQALWHAGQVLRASSLCHPSMIRDFYAIALYHSSLTFWAYAIITAGLRRVQHNRTGQSFDDDSHRGSGREDIIWLDGKDGQDIQRFIAHNRGVPAIRDWTTADKDDFTERWATLDDPVAIMDMIIALLRRGRPGTQTRSTQPPLVENLSQLMRDLGHTARGIGRS